MGHDWCSGCALLVAVEDALGMWICVHMLVVVILIIRFAWYFCSAFYMFGGVRTEKRSSSVVHGNWGYVVCMARIVLSCGAALFRSAVF